MMEVIMRSFVLWSCLLVGCSAPAAIGSIESNNPDVHLELLFSHDGCDVYRFHDGGSRYFVKCSGHATTSVMETVKHGKSVRQDTVTVTTE
jgi:hypothetical protein